MGLKMLGAFVVVYALSRFFRLVLPKRDGVVAIARGYGLCAMVIVGMVLAVRWPSGTFGARALAIYAPGLLIWPVVDWVRLPAKAKAAN